MKNNMSSALKILPSEGPSEPSDVDLDKNGIHQNGGKASYSALISADDDRKETEIGGVYNKKDTVTPAGPLGVDVAVAPIKQAFSALQKKIFETENELERLESKFYTIVSRRAIELEGINDMTEEEIERHR